MKLIWPSRYLVPTAIFAALAVGAAAALFKPTIVVLALVALIGAVLILSDYRTGTAIAMILAPISSDNNLLKAFAAAVLLSFISLLLSERRGAQAPLSLPGKFKILYCLPYFLAFGAALFAIGVPYDAIRDPSRRELYTYYGYFAAHLLPSIAYFLLVILLGTSLSRSERPTNWIIVYCVSAGIAAATFLYSLATAGYGMTILQRDRNIDIFYSHANDWGAMLGTAGGSLVFLALLAKGRIRSVAVAALAVVLCALALSFSRGGYLVFCVSLAGLLVIYRKLKVMFGLLVLGGLSLFVIPDEVIERATLGLDFSTIAEAEGGSMTDELTAGRGGIFVRIVPEIFNAPLFGRGLGGMAWTDTFVTGRLDFTNPHNLYVEVLLDIGFVGLLVLAAWALTFVRHGWRASKRTDLPEPMAIFFSGLVCAFFGFLAMGLSNGHWFPRYEQSFLWMGFGMLLAYWSSPAKKPARWQADQPWKNQTMNATGNVRNHWI